MNSQVTIKNNIVDLMNITPSTFKDFTVSTAVQQNSASMEPNVSSVVKDIKLKPAEIRAFVVFKNLNKDSKESIDASHIDRCETWKSQIECQDD